MSNYLYEIKNFIQLTDIESALKFIEEQKENLKDLTHEPIDSNQLEAIIELIEYLLKERR